MAFKEWLTKTIEQVRNLRRKPPRPEVQPETPEMRELFAFSQQLFEEHLRDTELIIKINKDIRAIITESAQCAQDAAGLPELLARLGTARELLDAETFWVERLLQTATLQRRVSELEGELSAATDTANRLRKKLERYEAKGPPPKAYHIRIKGLEQERDQLKHRVKQLERLTNNKATQ